MTLADAEMRISPHCSRRWAMNAGRLRGRRSFRAFERSCGALVIRTLQTPDDHHSSHTPFLVRHSTVSHTVTETYSFVSQSEMELWSVALKSAVQFSSALCTELQRNLHIGLSKLDWHNVLNICALTLRLYKVSRVVNYYEYISKFIQ